eukprot:scaffold517_cov119-Cylindrotheca_fusiformis.AAC.43
MVQVELSISAKKLKNVAGAFKGTSDPFAVVTQIATNPDSKPRVLGKTEVVKNSLNPQWAKVFVFEYQLGSPMKIAVNIFDEVRKSENKTMGSVVFDVDDLMGSRGGTKSKKIRNNGGVVTGVIRKSEGQGVLRFQMSGVDLKNTEGFLRKSDPFFELIRRDDAAGGATFNTVFRSEVVKNSLSPDWKVASVELSQLCGGNLDLPFLVKIYDYESSGKHILMGMFETTVNAMAGALADSKIPLKVKGADTGTAILHKAELFMPDEAQESSAPADVSQQMANMSVNPTPQSSSKPTFVDYISGGCKLEVTVAIDFTGSNGDPRQPGTLHYLHQDGQLNDYEKAISAIVGILQRYDDDKMFPVLGFGAKYDGVVRHAFQCGSAQEVHGVDGVLSAYREVFKSGLIMSRPTVFNEVIQYASDRAEQSLNSAMQAGRQAYSILLLITDGCVSDITATAACLQQVSDRPMSVVIVGVGNADFSGMTFLDDSNKGGTRDVAQFVPFNEYSSSPNALSSVTLHEIPRQLVDFFQGRGIQPLSPQEVDKNSLEEDEEEPEIDLSLNLDEEEIVVARGGVDYSHWGLLETPTQRIGFKAVEFDQWKI